MATLHVRNVPPDVYEGLRAGAAREGRSINETVIRILRDTLERERGRSELLARLDALAKRVDLPADAPKPEDIIRNDRESR